MPVVKETSARLVKEKIPYEIISRDVVQSIKNPTALAIYIYLIILPSEWVIRRAHILDRFGGLGRDRYDKAMRELKEAGLVWVTVTRDGQGKIIDRALVVETLPKVGKPTIRENPPAGKTTLRETRPLKDTDSVKDTDITKEAAFKSFWDRYPKKVDKQKSKHKFLRLKPETQSIVINDVKIRAKADAQWLSGYAPNPTTYLNNARWEDEWQRTEGAKPQGMEKGFDYV